MQQNKTDMGPPISGHIACERTQTPKASAQSTPTILSVTFFVHARGTYGPRTMTNAKIKRTPARTKGRPCIRLEQLGHDVDKVGNCLGCGESTKATHIESARRIFWRRVTCKP
eukprot:16089466-Heterocapsa_arctica.AAC.1